MVVHEKYNYGDQERCDGEFKEILVGRKRPAGLRRKSTGGGHCCFTETSEPFSGWEGVL